MKRLLTILAISVATTGWSQGASFILKKSEATYARQHCEVTITTVRPGWQRSMDAKLWNKGTDKSCI